MRILLVHNYYQQPGGEDIVFESEADLLESFGHEVIRYTVHNNSIDDTGKIKLAAETLWNSRVYSKIQTLIKERKPQLAHFHNTFPLLSPSVYHAVSREKIPIVQTLHNYRLYCVNALLFRDGEVCEDCLGRTFAFPGVKNACYRGSRSASAVVAAMSGGHRLLGTWHKKVDRYIALTEFSRSKLLRAGLDESKVFIKPNFVHPDPKPSFANGGYALYVGRISTEKGIKTLLDAWQMLGGHVKLKIVGDGPMSNLVSQAARENPRIEWLGRRPSKEVYDLMGEAAIVIVPSEWYETFGRVVIEAFAKGTPVVAADGNCVAELVENEVTGVLFKAGDATHLAERIRYMMTDSGAVAKQMRHAARSEYEKKYTAEINYEMLLTNYQQTMDRVSGKDD